MKHLGTVYDNESDLLKALIQVHAPRGIECDPMYFKGNFYKNGVVELTWKFDIEPLDGVMQGDARDLSMHIKAKTLYSMILDPPFMFGIHGKSEQYYASKTYGIFKNFRELSELYIDILDEAYRMLQRGGVLFFKCQDYTDSKTTMTHCFVYQWAMEAGFYAKDLAILHLPKGKVANHKLTQRHLRKHHSYFWVFEANRCKVHNSGC